MLFNKATLVVDTLRGFPCKVVCEEHRALFVGCEDTPALAGFDAVEFAAVPTKAIKRIEWV